MKKLTKSCSFHKKLYKNSSCWITFFICECGGSRGGGADGWRPGRRNRINAAVRDVIFSKYNSLSQYQIGYLRQKLTDCQDVKWHLPFQIMLTKSLFSNPLKLPQHALPVLWLFPFVLWETSRENFPLGKLEVK